MDIYLFLVDFIIAMYSSRNLEHSVSSINNIVEITFTNLRQASLS